MRKPRSRVGYRLTHPHQKIKTGHRSRQNPRKYTSGGLRTYRVPDSPFTHDDYIPTPSGFTRGQGWGLLNKAWLGLKIANDREGYFERLAWAITIQNVQTDLGIKRMSFPQLGLFGDFIFMYDKQQEEELRQYLKDIPMEQRDDLRRRKQEYKHHVSTIVESSFMTDAEKELLPRGFEGKVEKLVLVDMLTDLNRHNQGQEQEREYQYGQ